MAWYIAYEHGRGLLPLAPLVHWYPWEVAHARTFDPSCLTTVQIITCKQIADESSLKVSALASLLELAVLQKVFM